MTAEGSPERRTPDLVAVAPHQDDEVLSMGAAILEAVAAGRSVDVLLVSRGEASVVRTRRSWVRRKELPRRLGYVPTPRQFSALRDREFEGAVLALGATPVLPSYEARLPDGEATPEAVDALFRAHVPAGTVAVTTSAYDSHPDHRACGRALAGLLADGYVSQAAWFISPERLDLVPEEVAVERVGQPVTGEHQRPYRVRDAALGWWAIGDLSVGRSFDYQLRRDPFAYRHG